MRQLLGFALLAGLSLIAPAAAISGELPSQAPLVSIVPRDRVVTETARSNPGFGSSLAASQTWVAAYWSLNVDQLDTEHGRVRLYRRDGMHLRLAQVLAPEDLGLQRTLNFGSGGLAFSADGQALFVAMTSYHEGPFGPGGHVFVYRLDENGLWALSQTLEQSAPDGTTAHFGLHIAAADGIVAIGEPFDALPGESYLRGKVHIYREDPAGQWQHEVSLVPSQASIGSTVGQRFALADDQLVVAYDNSTSNPTKLTVFNHQGGGWIEGTTIASTEEWTLYGSAMAYSPDQQCLSVNALVHRVVNDLWDKTAVFTWCRDGDNGLELTDMIWDGDTEDIFNYADFGARILHVGDALYVSAPGATVPVVGSGGGMLYEFHGSNHGGWWPVRRHLAPVVQDMVIRRMGAALVGNGPLLVMGAPGTDHLTNPLMNGLVLSQGVGDVFVSGFD